jgi:hypothetical protein
MITLYKGTNKNMKCRRKQYELDKTYTYKRKVEICETGFHACRNLEDVFIYYSFGDKARYFVVSTPMIIDESSGKVVCKEITFIRELSVQEIQEVVLKLNNSGYTYDFARHMKGADIGLLQEKIIELGDYVFMCLFAAHVKGANTALLQSEVLKSKDFYHLIKFAENVKDANIELLQDTVIKFGGVENIYRFARDVEGADINLLQSKIIEKEDPAYICLFAENVKRSNIDLLELVIKKIGIPTYTERFNRIKGIYEPNN